MSVLDRLRNWFLAPLLDETVKQRLEVIEARRDYRTGRQKRFLKTKPGGKDYDNLVINFTGLVIDRSVTMLFGKGVKFDLPGDDDTPEDRYLGYVWDANKQQILLHKAALFGGEQGTCYLKLLPEELPYRTPEGEELLLPRLVALDPAWVTIETRPDDVEYVLRYVIRYAIQRPDGKDEAHKQEIEFDPGIDIAENGEQAATRDQSWVIRDYVASEETQGKWLLVGEVTWEYEFPPILHWQNLPEPTDIYGAPDVTDDVIELQDRVNFIASNISKIIRLYAHPMRWGRNITEQEVLSTGADKMINLRGDNSAINQLDPVGDLASSVMFLDFLQRSLFDITQTADLSSLKDKLGSLTNFALKVLFWDALAKLGTKRELYGDALRELNHRLLVLGNFQNTDGGVVVWPDVLPVDDVQQGQALRTDMEMGVVSKRTASAKRGYDWTQEEERISEERANEQANSSNIGDLILQNFTRGGGQQ